MIYFVRHGQTFDNFNNIIQGNGDLTPLGVEQAKETAVKLKDVKFDICFCSPLKRTKQTLKEILKFHKNLEVIYDNRLIERDYDEVVGKHFSEIINFEGRWKGTETLPYKIESLDDFYNRVASFYNDIKKQYGEKTVLVVSHNGVAKMSNAYFNGIPKDKDFSTFSLKNGSFHIFDYKK